MYGIRPTPPFPTKVGPKPVLGPARTSFIDLVGKAQTNGGENGNFQGNPQSYGFATVSSMHTSILYERRCVLERTNVLVLLDAAYIPDRFVIVLWDVSVTDVIRFPATIQLGLGNLHMVRTGDQKKKTLLFFSSVFFFGLSFFHRRRKPPLPNFGVRSETILYPLREREEDFEYFRRDFFPPDETPFFPRWTASLASVVVFFSWHQLRDCGCQIFRFSIIFFTRRTLKVLDNRCKKL